MQKEINNLKKIIEEKNNEIKKLNEENENNIKENTLTKTEDKKDDNADDYVIPVRTTIRRSNSIKLYKRKW